MSKEICHVCKKGKKPYHKFMNMDVFNIIQHHQAREDGSICERCDTYFALTGEFKEPTDEELRLAQKSVRFAKVMLKWWEKDNKMDIGDPEDIYAMPDEEKNKRSWGGLVDVAKWYRKEFAVHAKAEGGRE